MIKYNFGDIRCEIDFNELLSITINGIIKYKSDFKDFSEFYEILERNMININHIIFNGYEYKLKNGLLHNLYGPAVIKYNSENPYYVKGESKWYYINGKLVHDNVNNTHRGCRKNEDFLNSEIFYHEELTYRKSGRDPSTGKMYRRKEGVDYIRTIIDLKELQKIDKRNKKLKKLNEI